MSYSRSFTLLELLIVFFLAASLLGTAVWSLKDLLVSYRFRSEAEEIKNLFENLQIESMVLGSDIEVNFYTDRSVCSFSTQTEEKVIKREKKSLKYISAIKLNGKEEPSFRLTFLSTGSFLPPSIIQLTNGKQNYWIDLSHPIQISFSNEEIEKYLF